MSLSIEEQEEFLHMLAGEVRCSDGTHWILIEDAKFGCQPCIAQEIRNEIDKQIIESIKNSVVESSGQ